MRDAGHVAGAGLLLGAAAALLVGLLGVQPALRGWYGLHPSSPSPVTISRIFLSNVLLCAGGLAAAVFLRCTPRARPVLDPVLAGVLALNTLFVGVALGAYGAPLLRLVAVHAALELLALGAVGAAYLQARRGALSLTTLARCAAASTSLLILAAILETNGA
jgi:hypothetical protein